MSPSGEGSVKGLAGLDPCPAVVLGAIENNIAISLGCYPGVDQEPTTPGGKTVIHTCGVANIPIQKWVNLLISVYGKSLDVYIRKEKGLYFWVYIVIALCSVPSLIKATFRP